MRRSVDLAPLTTYKFGGPADFYADVDAEPALERLLDSMPADLPVLIVGRGSNLVISDEGFAGLVLHLSGDFLDISVTDEGDVHAGGGASLPRVARAAAKMGRGGLEFFVGIPGSIGGAVKMNGGCHGSETKDWLRSARVVNLDDGSVAERSTEELGLAYRHSRLTGRDLVIRARFRTVERSADVAEALIRDITRWRKEHQPGGTYNAGSVFKNPPGDAAGRIIDELGLKGYRRGGAAVSDVHANFFVATEEASAQDVYDLVWAVRRVVGEETGVWLEPEISFAGPFVVSEDEAQESGRR